MVCYLWDMARKDGATLLDEAMTRRRLTREKAAAKVKTTGATISRLRNRDRGPGLALAFRLRRAFGIPLEAWISDESI